KIVELTVVDIGAGCAEWGTPVVETRLTPGGGESEIVLHTRPRLGTGPRRVIGTVVVEPGHDSQQAPEITERRDARLDLGALERGQPVLAIDLDVDELDERRAAHSRDSAARADRRFAVLDLHETPAHAGDLFPVGVEIHVTEEENRIPRRIRARRDPYVHDRDSAVVREERDGGVAAAEGVVGVA